MAGFWICLVKYAKYILNILNTLALWIWQGHEYARATQGAEYAWIKPEYVLMSQCAWLSLNTMNITLNLIKYVGIYLKNSAEYARILNVSDTVQSIKSLHKLLSSCRDRETYSEHYQTFKMQRFAKRIMTECRSATRNFQGKGDGDVCGTRALR